MMQMIEGNWLVLGAALVVVVLIAWLLLRLGSTTPRQRHHAPDALDEGAAPAQRNQAFIDAPPAAAAAAPAIVPLPVSVGMAGIGEVIAVAAQDKVEAAQEAGDDLSRIKGVGPKLVALLHGLGVRHYAQIAAWDEADLARIDAQLGAFAGRAKRDNWVEQCALLAADDRAGYEAKFGKL